MWSGHVGKDKNASSIDIAAATGPGIAASKRSVQPFHLLAKLM
jgi:hypothetical protein